MRIVFIGCVQFSHEMLTLLLTLKSHAQVVGIVTRRESAFNSDFVSLEQLANEHGIPCLFSEGNQRASMADWIRSQKPDVIYCLGWSYLLKQEVLTIPRLGVVGYHPAALPQNRGRHPIIWALVLGLEITASTFFLMDEGADSGNIVDQVPISILPDDNAASLYSKLILASRKQLPKFTQALAEGTLRTVPQDHTKATYWRKRGKNDGLIDFRMSARSIHNLVRALARPYPGAHLLHESQEIKVWKTSVNQQAPLNIEPGKVICSGPGYLEIKCGEGSINLLDHEFTKLPAVGTYL